MAFSTKSSYALRVMVDLAEHENGGYIPMKEVADRQELSLKYLEKILPALTKAGLIDGLHGKGGGYRLGREPDRITVWDVLVLTEGDLAPTNCLGCDAVPCARAADCRTLPMWKDFYRMIKDYFSAVTIADLMNTDRSDNYVI